jgi:signal transduction histidine kinase/DNA-binding response OmpR family regulator
VTGASPPADEVDPEVRALRQELNESNQGLLALHTELLEQQDMSELARAAAEQATRDKADFLANMSHEIRSPMNAVIGFTSLLRTTELTSEQAEYTDAVEAASAHLLGVINDILDLSKIESGLLDLEAVPFDLFACVDDAIDMLAAKAGEKNLILAALFAPGTPASIVGDSLRLRQILVNLLANAVKFTTDGHVMVEVEQQPAGGDDYQLAFHVRDTGSGIPADRIEQLFAPYTQADVSTARSHGGTGLGLTISRQLAEQMGGVITVDSTVGAGSTFTCRIRARAAGPGAMSGESDPPLPGTRVLVVHSQALHAEVIGCYLRSWGAEIITAPSIAAAVSRLPAGPPPALAIIEASQPDAVAADIARLTEACPAGAPPVICVTTLASRAAISRAGEPGPSVRTPIRRDHLRKAVLTALGVGPESTHDVSRDERDQTALAAMGPVTRHLLYVDDNPLLTTLVERIFAKDPAVIVTTAPDGQTGLDLAYELHPDIVLVDLHLTGMSGETLLRQLHDDARTQSIPVIVISGDIGPGTIERVTSLGVVAYLTKPFAPQQLRELVSRVSCPGQ